MSNPGIPDPVVTAPVVAPQIVTTAPTEPVQATPVVTPTPVAPVVETPPVAVVEAPVAPVTPVVAPTPEVKPAAAPEKVAQTVIGAELDKKPVVAPGDVNAAKPLVAPVAPDPNTLQPVAEAPKTDGGLSDEPAPPPKYDDFKLPEGITLDGEKVSDFTKLLSDLEVKTKLPHEEAQKLGQELIDRHINEVKNQMESVQKLQLEAWENQKVAWKDEFLKDTEIGGNRWQTTVDSALTFIRTHGGSTEQQQEFRNLMETSGLGNHPAMIRLLANAGRAMSEGQPLTATRPVTAPKSKVQTMYGKN